MMQRPLAWLTNTSRAGALEKATCGPAAMYYGKAAAHYLFSAGCAGRWCTLNNLSRDTRLVLQ